MMARVCLAFGAAAVMLPACGGSSSDIAAPEVTTADTEAVTKRPTATSAPATTVEAAAVATTVGTTAATGSTGAASTIAVEPDVDPPAGRFESPDGRFAVEFAEAPTEQTFGAESTDGTPITVLAYLGSIEGGAGIASCVDVGDVGELDDLDAADVLDEAIEQALANFGAELETTTPVELQGRQGRAFAATGAGGPVVGRAFLDGEGVCEVIALITGEGDGSAFVESFEFLEAAA